MTKEKKKKSSSIILFIFVIVIAVTVAMQTEIGKNFFDNYFSNFKKNTNILIEKFNIPINTVISTSQTSDENTSVVYNQTSETTPEPTTEPTTEPTAEPNSKSSVFASFISSLKSKISTKNLEPKSVEKSATTMSNSKIVAFENASSVKYERYKNYLVCANETSLMAFDKNGNSLWAIATQNREPILDVSGDYILLAEKGGNNVSVFVGKKQLFSTETQNAIISASISSNGDVAVVTEKSYYLGSVVIYNKSGKSIFVWNSGKYDVLDAAISPSRKVAVALLDTETSVNANIHFFELTKSEAYQTQTFEDTIVFDIEFLGETLNAISDNKIIGLSNKGKILWTTDYSQKTLDKYSLENSGFKVFMYDNNISAEISLLDAHGKEKISLKSESIPDFVDIYSKYIAYNNGRNLIFGEFTGKNMKEYSSAQDIKKSIILDYDSVLIVYNSSLEFCKL